MDPGQNVYGHRDVAFKDGRVAAVAERIDPAGADRIIDVTGKLVTPGFIDIHGHFYHDGTSRSTDADETCLSAGVTTAVDAGSAGWANYGAMRDYVFPSRSVRLLAFLHIGASGLLLSRVVGVSCRTYVSPTRTALPTPSCKTLVSWWASRCG